MMRDTQRLLAHLRALAACVPVTATVLACDADDAAASRVKADGDGSELDDSGDRAESGAKESVAASGEANAAVKPSDAAKLVVEAKPSETVQAGGSPPTRTLPGYLIGDPPLVEGYNPEEEPCPSGDWCGRLATVEPLAVPRASEEAGCPTKIVASLPAVKELDPKSRLYRGLSLNPAMQGTFKSWYTARAREREGVDDLCCYHWFEYCSGRALMDTGKARVGDLEPGDDADGWSAFELPPAASWETVLPEAVRAELAAAWKHDALQEHASIASFARAGLELLAVGAPADLVAATQLAGLDEVVHTRACLALARRYGASAVRPSALPALPAREASLTRLCRDTFLEACVGETIATLRATRQLRGCDSLSVRAVLERIVEDEARHAALGWATVRWAIARGGQAVRDALRIAAAEFEGGLHRPSSYDAVAAGVASESARSGRLSAEQNAAVVVHAWHEVIRPMIADALA